MIVHTLKDILCWCSSPAPAPISSVHHDLFTLNFFSSSSLSLSPPFINYPDSLLLLPLRLDHYLLSLYPIFLSLFITQPIPCMHVAISPTVCLLSTIPSSSFHLKYPYFFVPTAHFSNVPTLLSYTWTFLSLIPFSIPPCLSLFYLLMFPQWKEEYFIKREREN